MMRLLLILILTSCFQILTKADDIRDFEIEGMSIGGSALDYFSLSHIKENSWDYPNKKFIRVQNDKMSFFKTYDAVDFNYKTKDTKYIIQDISGVLFFNKNFDECYKKMDSIIFDIESSFNQIKFSDKNTYKHQSPKNKSGKSKITDVYFDFKNGDGITIACYYYSKEHAKNQNHLSIGIYTDEFATWLEHKAYK